MNPPEPLPLEFAEPLARAASRFNPFGRRIVWYSEVTSTNDVAGVLAERGEAEGTVVVGNLQTAGRGRHGRVWVSPAGAGLYVSLVLRPRERTLGLVTLVAGLAVAEGIDAATGLSTSVKWPNDIYVGPRKLAGILAEAGSSQQSVQHAVLGIGINVRPTAYPADIAARATSLESELGRTVDRGLLLTECLAAFALRYRQLQDDGGDILLDAWRRRAASTFGRPVAWDAAGTRRHGVADDVDGNGALLVRTDAGRERVISGEVTWL